MDKYVGQYRVKCEKDINGEVLEKGQNTYIQCKRKVEIYRKSGTLLELYAPFLITAKTLDKIKVNFKLDRGYKESQLWFDESDLEEILKVFPPNTKGKNIKPKNKYSSKVKKS